MLTNFTTVYKAAACKLAKFDIAIGQRYFLGMFLLAPSLKQPKIFVLTVRWHIKTIMVKTINSYATTLNASGLMVPLNVEFFPGRC